MRQLNLLRTNLTGREPAQRLQFFILRVEIEASCKNLQDDLQLPPIYHQLQSPIEALICRRLHGLLLTGHGQGAATAGGRWTDPACAAR